MAKFEIANPEEASEEEAQPVKKKRFSARQMLKISMIALIIAVLVLPVWIGYHYSGVKTDRALQLSALQGDVQLLDAIHQALERFAFEILEMALDPVEDHLTDLLIEGHVLERGGDPLLRGWLNSQPRLRHCFSLSQKGRCQHNSQQN